MTEQEHIPGIYNYCNRWCERCRFSHRCALFAREQAAVAEDPAVRNMQSEAFWHYLTDQFKEVERLLREESARFGIDDADLTIDEAAVDRHQANFRAAQETDFARTARTYGLATHTWFQVNESLLQEQTEREAVLGLDGAEMNAIRLTDACDVISWYCFQIGVKLQRAEMSLQDAAEHPDEPVHQHDANGSAKVALMGIEHSLGAWNIVYQLLPDHQDELLDFLAQLQRIRRLTLARFPRALAFQRPGFDTEA